MTTVNENTTPGREVNSRLFVHPPVWLSTKWDTQSVFILNTMVLMEMRPFSFKRWNARTFVFTCDGASTGVGWGFPGEAGWARWVGGDLWLAGRAGRVVGRPRLDVFATKRLRNTDHILWKKFIQEMRYIKAGSHDC